MISTARPRGSSPFGVPSRDRIRKMTAEIQKTWSSRTRARRSAEGSRRVESVIAALLFDDGKGQRDGD